MYVYAGLSLLLSCLECYFHCKMIHNMSTVYSPAILDIVLSFNAWRTLKYTQTFRYLLKLAFAAFWLVVMPIAYSRSVQNPRGIIRFFNTLGGNWQTQSLYYYCVAIYLVPNILSAILFLLPCLRRSMERSNWRIISILMWWSQASLYELIPLFVIDNISCFMH